MNTPSHLPGVPLGVLIALLAGTAIPLSASAPASPRRTNVADTLVALASAAAAPAPTRPSSPAAPPAADDINTRVSTLIAESGGRITASTYGTSRQGRPLHLLRIGDENRPAILIAAGLNPQHRVGIDAALGVAKKLAELSGNAAGAEGDAAALANVCIYIMPCADPDGVERERTASIKLEGARTPAPWDDDADGRIDEDAPADLNGDGYITLMRVPDPPAAYGLEATEMRDPADPRLTKRPDRAKGERPQYAFVIEGRDQDGDGRIAEDGVDGADLARNFPYHWPEFQEGAGPFPLGEPETRSIAEWVMARPNLVGVVVFGTHDNIVNVPEAGKFDQTQRVPNGIENDDKAVWEEMSKLFKDATGMTGVSSVTNDSAGTLHGWTYAFLGIWSFSTPVWVRPDLVTKADKPSEPAAPAAGGPPTGSPAPAGGGAPAPSGVMSDAEVATMIERFRAATPEQRREMMQQSMTLPQETQDKLRAAAMAAFAGQVPDVAPPSPNAAATPPPATGQPVTAPAGQPAGAPADAPRGPRGGPGGAGGPGGGRGPRGRGGPGGGGPGGPGGGPGGNAPAPAAAPSGDDAKWLKYSDDKRDKSGFIDFKPFDHPQLGTVEIGGFVPGFKLNPPEADEPALIDQQTKFITQLAAKLPKIQVEEPWVEDIGGGLWRIGVRVSNEGAMPTRSALALKARRLPPLRVVLDAPEDAVLVGTRTVRINSLAANGDGRSVEWTVLQPAGGDVKVSVKSPEYGDQTLTIPLKATPRKQKVPVPPVPPAPPTPPPPPSGPAGEKPADAAPPSTPSTPATPPTDKPAPTDPQEGTR